MQARLSRPLSHVSKAAWKSLRTIICSAAVSNMLNSRVAEGASGGLQVGPRQRAAAMLLISRRHKNTLLKTSLTPSVLHPETCFTPTRCPKTVSSVYLLADVCLPSKTRFTSWYVSVSQSQATILSSIREANRVALHFDTRHFF